MFEKRGQFTIFVILGFVLLVAFALMFYVRSFIVQGQLQDEAQKTVDEVLKNTHIDLYVESCLDRVTDDAVYLLGLQGGVLYKSQGGTYPNPKFVGDGSILVNMSNVTPLYNNSNYGFLNVSRAITINLNKSDCTVSSPPYFVTPPYYPFINISLSSILDVYRQKKCDYKTGAFGVLNLAPLCNPYGENSFAVAGFNNSCQNRHYGNSTQAFYNLTIQQQLEHYISNKTVECVDFSIFKNIGYNITVINIPTTNLTFGRAGFTVQSTYPFKVRIKGKSITAFAKFQVRKKIYLKELYEYIRFILTREYENIFFDLDKDYKYVLGFDSGIRVERKDDPCFNNCPVSKGKYDNLFSIIDNRSEIRGKPFIFNLVVKNRVPALDLINSGQIFDVVALEGSKIKLTPFGKDADESLVKYNYSGWKEDYDSWFNESCCPIGNCLPVIKSCTVRNITYNKSCPYSNPTNCFIYNLRPLNWTSSKDFIDTGVNASIKTDNHDIGLHHVIISVKDEEGLMDFQNVSVLVFDQPETIPGGNNNYSDISDRNASIEDPYILNARIYSFISNVTKFQWNDTTEKFTINTAYNKTIIPQGSFDIENIKPLHFTKFNASLNESIHNITLKGKFKDLANGRDLWTTTNTMQVQVSQCLPHRDKAAPYPYNEWSENNKFTSYNDNTDPFQANHTCCDDGSLGFGWGNITKGNLCYDYVEYGTNKTIKLNKFNRSSYPSGVSEKWISYTIGEMNKNIENDILKRTFQRTCDGSRGNICNGTATQKVIVQESCPDLNLTIPNERCSGPPLPLATASSKTPVSCYDYDKTTFEKEFGYGGSGSCNYEPKCSNLGISGYGATGGEFLCNATCNGRGGCDTTTLSTCIDCRKNDVVATDSDGGDNPKKIGTCTGGKTGTCSNSQCITKPNHSYTDSFKGCPGENCKLIEYYPSNEHPDPNGIKESCEKKDYFTRTKKDACEAYKIKNPKVVWINTLINKCCGDERDEEPKSDPLGNQNVACCKPDQCGWSGSCYNINTIKIKSGKTAKCTTRGWIIL